MTDPKQYKGAAPRLFQTIAADGAAAHDDQLSRTRKLFVLFVAGLLFVAAPLAWAGSAAGAGGSDNGPEAVLVKQDDQARDDQDDPDPSGDDTTDDDTTDVNTTDAATGTTDNQEATGGDDADTGTGMGTRGATGEAQDVQTAKETGVAKTDRAGLETGVSTLGETDRGDATGQTERR
jgi:hypothetical protein